MTAPELLPCPLCGGEAETDHRQPFWHYATGKTGYQTAVYCRDCVVNLTLCHDDHPGADPDDLMAELVAAWNRRTPSPEVAALIAEARREGWNAAIEAANWLGLTFYDKVPKGSLTSVTILEYREAIRALKETTHE